MKSFGFVLILIATTHAADSEAQEVSHEYENLTEKKSATNKANPILNADLKITDPSVQSSLPPAQVAKVRLDELSKNYPFLSVGPEPKKGTIQDTINKYNLEGLSKNMLFTAGRKQTELIEKAERLRDKWSPLRFFSINYLKSNQGRATPSSSPKATYLFIDLKDKLLELNKIEITPYANRHYAFLVVKCSETDRILLIEFSSFLGELTLDLPPKIEPTSQESPSEVNAEGDNEVKWAEPDLYAVPLELALFLCSRKNDNDKCMEIYNIFRTSVENEENLNLPARLLEKGEIPFVEKFFKMGLGEQAMTISVIIGKYIQMEDNKKNEDFVGLSLGDVTWDGEYLHCNIPEYKRLLKSSKYKMDSTAYNVIAPQLGLPNAELNSDSDPTQYTFLDKIYPFMITFGDIYCTKFTISRIKGKNVIKVTCEAANSKAKTKGLTDILATLNKGLYTLEKKNVVESFSKKVHDFSLANKIDPALHSDTA